MSSRRMFLAVFSVLAAFHFAARADMPGCDLASGGDSFTNKGACCDTHDKCYADNGCTEASWNGSEGPVCSQCNVDVVGCFRDQTPGRSICTLIPGHGVNGTLCQDPAYNCGWYCWSGMVGPPPICTPNCPSACGQPDGCGGLCPLFTNGWTCDLCLGCNACGDCPPCGGRCQAPFVCDPSTGNCICTDSCSYPLCGQQDRCGRACPNNDDSCDPSGGYTNACGRYCAPQCSWYDCTGACNGNTWWDSCGVCGGDGSSCRCNWYDCTGTCNGNTWWDQCGVCGGDGSSCMCWWYDCFGICNGPYWYDECGVCGGDGWECWWWYP